MTRARGPVLGPRMRDVLDTLLELPGLTVMQLARETGADQRCVRASIESLLQYELVEPAPAIGYVVTDAGARELELRVRAGMAPGAAGGGSYRRARRDSLS